MPDPEVQIYCEHSYGEPDLIGLSNLAKQVLKSEHWEFSATLILVDDDAIVQLNRRYLQENSVTDVIAFQVDEVGEGEIYINLDDALRQALELNEPVDKTLRRLVVHGLLHLGGWNDKTEAEREKMLAHGEQYV